MTESNNLPARPNLEYLRKLAKKRMRLIRAKGTTAKLADVQLLIAREAGFASWKKLKSAIEVAKLKPAPTQSVRKADWKPIMDASFAGDAKRVAKLLDEGADPNALSKNAHRHRPLHRAIEHKKTIPKHAGHEQVVKILLERGADPNLRGTWSRVDALQLAASGEPRFVPLLVEHFKPLDIFRASMVLDDARVAALLKQDRKLAKSMDAGGWTPLHHAAASGMFKLSGTYAKAQLRIARLLIEAGADPNAHYPFDQKWPISVLYHACGQHNNPALTELLLHAGANPCDGESVYHASDEGHAECLDLIEKHVSRKKLAKECTWILPTQLHWGRTRGVSWLLAHGADPGWVDPKRGMSAIQEARKRGKNAKLIALLEKHRKKGRRR